MFNVLTSNIAEPDGPVNINKSSFSINYIYAT
jgi:hypothetical protein